MKRLWQNGDCRWVPIRGDWECETSVLPLSRLWTGRFIWQVASDTDDIPSWTWVTSPCSDETDPHSSWWTALSCFPKNGARTGFLPVEKKMTDSLWNNGCPSSVLCSFSSSSSLLKVLDSVLSLQGVSLSTTFVSCSSTWSLNNLWTISYEKTWKSKELWSSAQYVGNRSDDSWIQRYTDCMFWSVFYFSYSK